MSIPITSNFNYPLAQGIHSSKAKVQVANQQSSLKGSFSGGLQNGHSDQEVNGIVRHSMKEANQFQSSHQNLSMTQGNVSMNQPNHSINSSLTQTTPTRIIAQVQQPLPQMISPMRIQSTNTVDLEKSLSLLKFENENLKRQLSMFSIQIQTLLAAKIQLEKVISGSQSHKEDIVSTQSVNDNLGSPLQNQIYVQNVSLNTKDQEIASLKAQLASLDSGSEDNFRLKSEVIALSNLVETLQSKNANQEAIILSFQSKGNCEHDSELVKENLEEFDKIKGKLLKKKAKLKLMKAELKAKKKEIEKLKESAGSPELILEYNAMKSKIINLEEIQEKYNSMLAMFVSVNAELESLRARVGNSGVVIQSNDSPNRRTESGSAIFTQGEKQLFRRTSGHFMDSIEAQKRESPHKGSI